MPASFYVIEFGCCAFALGCYINAWKQGRRWFMTILAATLFGLGVELFFLWSEYGSTKNAYYTYGNFMVMIGWSKYKVPLWVGLGWGSIAYASIWSANRLNIPIGGKTALSALLAVNIDLSLDPIAELMGFWTWHNAPAANYYGVPFDNFLGWLMIVGTYALSLLFLFDKIPKTWKGVEYWVPFVAMVPALLLTAGGQWILNKVYAWAGQQVVPFMAIIGVAVAISVYWGCRNPRNLEPNWCVLALPVFYHLLLLGIIILTGKYLTMASLVVIVPVDLFLAFTAFAWNSLDRIFPTAGA